MFCVCPRRVGFFAEKKFRENFANFCFLLTSIPAINACKHFSKCWTENKSQFIFVKKVLNAFKLFYFIHFIILDVKLKRNCKAEHFSFVIFGAKILAKKAHLKCWWNWHLFSAFHLHPPRYISWRSIRTGSMSFPFRNTKRSPSLSSWSQSQQLHLRWWPCSKKLDRFINENKIYSMP